MTFGLIEIDSKIIKFEQVGPDISFSRFEPSDWQPSWKYEKLNCHWVKFITPGGNVDSSIY